MTGAHGHPAVRRRTWIAVGLLTAASLLATVGSILADPTAPTRRQWAIGGILLVVGLVGVVASRRWAPPDDESSPPWDVHTLWLLPAALLTPPAVFWILVAVSIALTIAKRGHPLELRIVVCCITVLTTVALHLAALLIDDIALAGLAGIAALWIIGVVVAVAVSYVFITPAGTATWLDYRWSLVQFACAFAALVLAGAMDVEPLMGFAGIAPLLLAAFALRWPELDRNALIDAKTQLPNARHWEDRSRELLVGAELHEVPAAIMIVDIDRFKTINDIYGHLAGDQVLVELARLLRSQVDTSDLVARFGGEEFVITMFEVDSDTAVAAADRIRRAVAAEEHVLEHPLAEIVEWSGAPGEAQSCRITCTIGVASSEEFGYDLSALLGQADAALVDGKASGRNRVGDARTMGRRPGQRTLPRPRNAVRWWDVALQRRAIRRSRLTSNRSD